MDNQPLPNENQASQESLDDRDFAKAIAPVYFDNAVVGFVEEIHGTEGEECPEYKPTRDELLQIARYWAEVSLDIQLEWFYWLTSGSRAIRLAPYAAHRIDKIALVLGEEAVQQAVRDVWKRARRLMGEEVWRIFSEGTELERDEYRDKLEATYEYLKLKCQDKTLTDKVFAFLKANPTKIYLDDAGDLWSLTESRFEDDPAANLMLRITAPDGTISVARGYSLVRPSKWQAPYGLAWPEPLLG